MTTESAVSPAVPEEWAEIARRNVASYRGRFEALADPLKVIHVDPQQVPRICTMHLETKRKQGSSFHDWGKVIAGEWDETWRGMVNRKIVRTPVYRAVRDHYALGIPWEETGIIDHKVQQIEERGTIDHCSSREDVVERYRRFDAIFEDIKENGFRLVGTQRFENLFVSIGRDGRLLLARAGHHRFAMALVLGLQRIPVYVLSRHEEWQRTRDRYAVAGTPREAPHPDLAEFSESTS